MLSSSLKYLLLSCGPLNRLNWQWMGQPQSALNGVPVTRVWGKTGGGTTGWDERQVVSQLPTTALLPLAASDRESGESHATSTTCEKWQQEVGPILFSWPAI